MRGKALCIVVALITPSALEAIRSPRFARPAAPFLYTPMDERGAAFSPDGNTVVYALRIGEYRQVLVVVERHGRRWGEPRVPHFSGVAYDGTPSFSPDGRTLYFASNRAATGGTKGDFDIWTVARTRKGWGTPEPVRGDVNTPANETGPTLTRSGRLYFASSQSGGSDIYVADSGPDGFENTVSVGDGVNTKFPEAYPAVSPDEKFMVFVSSGRPDQLAPPGQPYGRTDLYISHRIGDRWGPARQLDRRINTRASESSPYFSADGRRFYFMSEYGFATDQRVVLRPQTLRRGLASARNGLGNIYVVPVSEMEGR